MRYQVTLAGKTREIDVEQDVDGKPRVRIDGTPFEGEFLVRDGAVSIRRGADVHEVFVGGKGERATIAMRHHRVIAQVENAQHARKKGAGASGPASKSVRSPMPGRVVSVRVQKGDDVAAQQTVVVVEAMKMENELRAAIAGKVAAVHVREGDNVEASALLISFE